MLTKLQKYLIGANLIALLLLTVALAFNSDSIQDRFSHLWSKETVQQEEPVQEELPPQELAQGRNHNNAASDYAYDVTQIRQYMTGEQEYHGEKLVFLTIDDGANHDVTPQILDILADHQVHATFFPIGLYINEENADLYQRQIHEGHAIALHSYYHDMWLLYPYGVPDVEQIASEAADAHNALKSILGLKFNTRVWRYPGGHMSWYNMETADQALEQQGLHWIDWNANVGDAEMPPYQPQTVEEMLNFHDYSVAVLPSATENIRVLLMHDAWGKHLTVETLPHLIQYYKDQGYRFGVLY